MDPYTGVALGAVGGSLTLINSMIRIAQDHADHPDAAPPNVAQLIEVLPAAALKATDDIIEQVKQLRIDCKKAGIDLELTLDRLLQDPGFYLTDRRRVLKTFQQRADAIGGELSVLFDDLVAVSNCADSLNLIAGGFEGSLKQKQKLREDTKDGRPVGVILDKLQAHAEQSRAQLLSLKRSR